MSETFEIGETEKHIVTVDFSLLTKHLKVVLDGTEITDEWVLSPSGKKVEFDIGGSEPHHVLVVGGGFRHTEVFVDGTQIQATG